MKLLKFSFTILLTLLVVTAWSQSHQFKLVNKNNLGLAGATFEYANQNGIADAEGLISFTFVKGETMFLSYLGYGQWQMGESALEEAIKEGVYIRQETSNALQPVTVISVRPKTSENENVVFDYQEKMSHDGGELLTKIPAISGIRKGGNYGLDPVMRGFKYDQLNIVMNGAQCATAACPNRMDPPTSQMAPNMLEMVEVYKGPYALRYGGGLGGTINYVTGESQFFKSSQTYGRLSGRYDSNGDVFKSEAMLGLAAEKYNVGLYGSWATGNDYVDGDDRTIQADFQRSSFGVKAGFLPSTNQTIEISAFLNQANDVDFPSLMMDLRSDKTLMLNGTHKVSFQDKTLKSWTTTVFLSEVDHLMDNRLKVLYPRMMDAQTDAETTNFGGRTEGEWTTSNSKLYVGADYKVENALGLRERNFLLGPLAGTTLTDNAWQHGEIQKAGLFGEYTYNTNGWQIVMASRIEWNSAKILDADDDFLEVYPDADVSQLNPNVSVGALKELNDGLSVGLWLARAQRSASLSERYINKFAIGQDPYELIGNPQLDPEINNQVDLTFEWKTHKSNLSLDVFGGLLQDFISSTIDTTISTLLPNAPGVRKFVNIEDAIKAGFEVSYSQNWNQWLMSNFSVAYTYAQDTERDQPLPEIAPLDVRFSLNGNFLKGNLLPQIIVRYVADQNRVSTEYGEIATPSFMLLDLNLDYNVTDTWKLQLGANNLLDRTYYEHLSRSTAVAAALPLNAPGRNIYVAFNYTL